MMQKILLAILFFSGVTNGLRAQTSYEERVRKYIATHSELAMIEQQRCGVPAAIKLGQGILETSAGDSRLCAGANNHFGIKCKTGWSGETFAHTDDAPNECFRKYPSVTDSYRDHSDFLSKSKRYAPLFQLDPTDYKGWAHGLKKCGYATNPKYAYQLIKIIEDFKLHEYTELALNKTANPGLYASLEVVPEYDRIPQDTPVISTPATIEKKEEPVEVATQKGVQIVNGLKAFYARKGDVLLDAAIKYRIHYPKLLEINDLPDAPLEADMFIYLEKKNTKGKHQRYIVQAGESLLQIAQAEGIQLKQLRAYNMLEPGEEPQPGTVLYLQQPAVTKPAVSVRRTERISETVTQPTASTSDYIIVKKGQNSKNNSLGENGQKSIAQTPQSSINIEKPLATSVEPQPSIAVAPATTMNGSAGENDDTETPLDVTPGPKRVVNIAAEPAVEELMANVETQEARPVEISKVSEEPQDELARLKAQMDKVVYGTTQTKQSKSGIKVEEEVLPVREKKDPVTAVPTTGTDDPNKYHIVQKGETAFGISKKYNITMKQLRDWNNLEFEAIRIGQKLRVKP